MEKVFNRGNFEEECFGVTFWQNNSNKRGGVMSNHERGYLRKGYRIGLIVYLFLWTGPVVFLNLPNPGLCIEKVFQISSIINNERIKQNTDGHSIFPLSDGTLVHSGLYPGESGGTGALNFTKFGLKGQIEFSRDFYSVSNSLSPFSAVRTSDGGYLIGGRSLDQNNGFIIKFDQDLSAPLGEELSLGNSRVEVMVAKETSEGGYIAGLRITPPFNVISNVQPSPYTAILKLRRDLSAEWPGPARLSQIELVYDIFETDNEYVIYGKRVVGGTHLRLFGVKKDGTSENWSYDITIPFPATDFARGSTIVEIRTNPRKLMIAHDYFKDGKNAILLLPFIPGPGNSPSLGKVMAGDGDVRLTGVAWGPTLLQSKDGHFLLGGFAIGAGGRPETLPFLVKLEYDDNTNSLLNAPLWQYVYLSDGNNDGGFNGLSELSSGEIVSVGSFESGIAHFTGFAENGINEGSCFERFQTDFSLLDERIEIPPQILLKEPVFVFPEQEFADPISLSPLTLQKSEAQVVFQCGQKLQNIGVTPTGKDFGCIATGDTANQTVTVKNTGGENLTLEKVGDPVAPFVRTISPQVKNPCTPGMILRPDESCVILVQFAPATPGSFSSSLSITSNDPDEKLVSVGLTGSGGERNIIVSPATVNFGIVPERETLDKTITVTNGGTCPINTLTLRTITNPVPPFSIVPGGTTCKAGQILNINESCSIVTRFAPMGAGQFVYGFDILSDDPDQPAVTVHLKGGSGPDLVGDLVSPLIKQCRTTWQGVQCTVTAVVSIMNIGTKDAPPSCLGIYLSGPGGFNWGSDPVLMETEVNGLRPGRSQARRFIVRLPPGETGAGLSLSIVNDCNSCIIEARKDNNIKSYPIPR